MMESKMDMRFLDKGFLDIISKILEIWVPF